MPKSPDKPKRKPRKPRTPRKPPAASRPNCPRKDGDQGMNTTADLLQRIVVDTVTATVPGDVKTAEAEMVVSTSGRDSEGDRILPEGVELDRFRRNPVLLWGHDAYALPIGTVTQLTVEPRRGLRARWRWLAGDPFADRVKNAWDQGIIRAASIGFLPLESTPNELARVRPSTVGTHGDLARGHSRQRRGHAATQGPGLGSDGSAPRPDGGRSTRH